MEKTNQSYLATEKIGKLMGKYAVPCIISLLVGALYNIVDQIFIANATYLGSYGNAANTVVFPLTVIALAISVMIGDGCCAFVSLSLGKNRAEDAKRSMANSVILTVIASVVLTAIYLIFSNQIIAMFGGTVNEETFQHSKEYFFWITLGIPFYMFGQAMNPVIRADGSPKYAMISTLAGAVINIILDPIFIFTFKWGMMGAAVATVMGQIATAVLAVWYLCHTKVVKLSKEDFKLKSKIIGKTLVLGICSFLSQISLVAAMAAGCIPIVGFNMGAGLKDRVKKLFTKLLFAEGIVGAAALIIVEFFPKQLIGIFGAANESVYYTDFAVKAFRIYLCMMIFACINKAAFIFLQAMGKAVASTMLSMVREIVFGVGLAMTLPLFFGLDGVLYSMPVSDILTAVLSAIVIGITYKQLSEKKTN